MSFQIFAGERALHAESWCLDEGSHAKTKGATQVKTTTAF
jgi:hypothetical protein